jgi:hypothetical protein
MSACNVLSLPAEVLVLVFEALVHPVRLFDQQYDGLTFYKFSSLVTRLDAVRLTCRVFNAVVTAHFANLVDRRRAALRACRSLYFDPPVVTISDYVRLTFLGVRYHRLTEGDKAAVGSHRAYRNKNVLDLITDYRKISYILVERRVANVTAAVDLLLSGTTDVVLPPRIRPYLRGTVPPAALDQLRRLFPDEFC